MKDIYDTSSKIHKINIREFSEQYEFDEISSMNVIPQAINTWPITAYEFNKFKKIILLGRYLYFFSFKNIIVVDIL